MSDDGLRPPRDVHPRAGGRGSRGRRGGLAGRAARSRARCSTSATSRSATSRPAATCAPCATSTSRSARGEVVGLAGESGCGKSTLAYGAVRLLRPPAVITSGSVSYRGRRVAPAGSSCWRASDRELRALRWREIAIVFQSAMNALNPVLRVRDQLLDALDAHLELSHDERHERIDDADRPRRDSARAAEQLPARALGRHAPAGDDRDGARRRARGRDHGRADDRARRRRPARDPRRRSSS